MTLTAENRVIVLTNKKLKRAPLVQARNILIAPSEWMYKAANLNVPGHGSLSDNFETIASVHTQPDRNYGSRHDVILQTNDVYRPHVILLAISQELGFEYDTLHDSVIGGIKVERAYYYYDLLPESKMIEELIAKSPTTLEGFLGLIKWHANAPIK